MDLSNFQKIGKCVNVDVMLCVCQRKKCTKRQTLCCHFHSLIIFLIKLSQRQSMLEDKIHFCLNSWELSFSWQWLLISFQNTFELHSECTLKSLFITFLTIADTFFLFLIPSRPLFPFLTFGLQPERGPFPRHISAPHHSHGLCLAGTHPSSSLNLLL